MNDPAPLRLRIDRAALTANWRRLARRAAPAACAAVVKADAYGLGLDVAVPALADTGCSVFFVATLEEAIRVRACAADADIYVLDGLVGPTDAYRRHRLRPILGNRDELDEWIGVRRHGGAKDGYALPAGLHVDTGMNRLGLSLAEFDGLISAGSLAAIAEAAGLCLLMSHLACADTPDHPLNAAQLSRFSKLRDRCPALPGSLANSAGIFLDRATHHDLVRPGIALYGGASHPDAAMQPVVTALARILQVRTVGAGETVGYGGELTLRRDSRIAILGAGYADGYLRAAGSGDRRPGAGVAIDGHVAPLAGRVSMDLIAVDVTDLPPGIARRGVYAELFGPTIAIDAVADHAGTIGYEMLTRLSNRATREVFDGAQTMADAGETQTGGEPV